MRAPRLIVKRKTIPYKIYSIDIVSTATESYSAIMHNVEVDVPVKQYNAVDIE